MLIETKAIVLHRSAYNERYQIVHLYTEMYGRLGVLLSNSRSRTASRIARNLTPLAEVEFIGVLARGKQLAQLRELRLFRPNSTLQSHPSKCSQSLFLSELLYRILREELGDSALYHFISQSLLFFHHAERGLANFYLCFTYQLLRFLAIEPTIDKTEAMYGAWFDLGEAQFTEQPSATGVAIPPTYAKALYLFSRMNYENMHRYQYNRQQRGIIIDYLLHYYRCHLPSFGAIKSLEILRQTASVSPTTLSTTPTP